MYLVAIGWLYVAVMMAVAEAFSSNGSVLGALITFVLYGLMPVALVLYLMGSPARRKAREAQEEQQTAVTATHHRGTPGSGVEPDAGGHAASGAPQPGITPVGKEP